ncbi:hypothetical protein HPG69_007894 [Diceros bicornis minor]|uniref:Uncharacterized protein n=1 Tax=Diceros bicornis minor TaxID=77932 RepID=A0A7J7EB51_DICBM|nr:hypothetical protein HPG69_007894 [Diceros bicornis minor]
MAFREPIKSTSPLGIRPGWSQQEDLPRRGDTRVGRRQRVQPQPLGGGSQEEIRRHPQGVAARGPALAAPCQQQSRQEVQGQKEGRRGREHILSHLHPVPRRGPRGLPYA